jgi:hypothetical protein
MKTESERSASGASSGAAAADFADGALSPVNEASFVVSATASSRRASAGTTSPASSTITSPVTISVAAITTDRPSRRTRARGAVSDRNARIARSARRSWENPIAPLIATMQTIANASAASPRTAETAQATASSQMTGLLNCRASSRQAGFSGSRAIAFAPFQAPRRFLTRQARDTRDLDRHHSSWEGARDVPVRASGGSRADTAGCRNSGTGPARIAIGAGRVAGHGACGRLPQMQDDGTVRSIARRRSADLRLSRGRMRDRASCCSCCGSPWTSCAASGRSTSPARA